MTKDVLVTVRGLQMTPDGDDTIEVTTTGKYYEKDGKRYLFYDEIGDDTNLIVKNSIQITEEHDVEGKILAATFPNAECICQQKRTDQCADEFREGKQACQCI